VACVSDFPCFRPENECERFRELAVFRRAIDTISTRDKYYYLFIFSPTLFLTWRRKRYYRFVLFRFTFRWTTRAPIFAPAAERIGVPVFVGFFFFFFLLIRAEQRQ
jgi:hypothetical protein